MKITKKIVVKVGTSTLTAHGKKLSRKHMLELTRQIAYLHEQNYEVILVTSGAVAAGKDILCHSTLESFPSKQMFSAVGQGQLMEIWNDLFSLFDIHVGQLLLTKEDFIKTERQLNTHNTLNSLFKHKVIPIINENDSVATEENRIGDNDNLAALVAITYEADLLILLTDQQGLYTKDPRFHPDATLISIINRIDESIFSLAKDSSTSLGTGGMRTKIEAAQKAREGGIQTVIAFGALHNVLIDITEGKQIGTTFQNFTSENIL
ncbi:MAG: glutamate 5-kinase [Chlamydiota bacterium]